MKKYTVLYITMLLFTIAGCRKYLDVNEDPRTPQLTTAETLLPHMQSAMGNAVGLDGRYTGKYVQYWVNNAANDGVEGHASAGGTEMWTMHYTKLGLALNQMENDATLKEKWYYVGVAKAIRAWSWQLCTDHFGEMILKQAWEADRYVFDYDSQEEIYKEVEKLCLEALDNFNKESTKPILLSSDFIFKGNKDRWVKFVYGILAINANHLSNKSTYDPAKVIEYANKSLADNNDNARIQYNGTTVGTAPATTSDVFILGPKRQNITSLSYVQSSVILNMLNGYHRGVSVVDPRIGNMMQKSADGNYYGAIPTFGDPNATPATNTKRIPSVIGGFAAPWPGRYLFRDTITFPIMTYSQIQFIKAEAALKSGQTGVAYTAYKEGIDKSMDFVSGLGSSTISATAKTTYLGSAAVAQTDADLTIKDIMCQKYIALWGWGFEETWADLRRYNYDTTVFKGYVIPEPNKLSSSNDGLLVQRYRPQTTEYSYNVKALEAIGATRDNYHTDKMWFVKP